MKYFPVAAILLLTAACDSGSQTVDVEAAATTPVPLTSSFTMRNEEIRSDMLVELTENNIEHWINDDGSIGFNMADVEEVDRLGNLVIGAYITRN